MPQVSEGDVLGRVHFPPPYRFEGANAFLYLLVGDRRSIERHIVRPALGAGFSAAGSGSGAFFLVSFADCARVESEAASAAVLGGYSCRESSVAVPVVENATGKTYWYIPVVYADGGGASAAARGFYGFPQSSGRIILQPACETQEGPSMETRVEIPFKTRPRNEEVRDEMVVGARYCQDLRGDLIEQEPRRRDGEEPEQWVGRTLRAADLGVSWASAAGARSLVDDAQAVARTLVEDAVLRTSPLLLLKRIPSAESPEAAVYEARVEVPASLLSLEYIETLPEAEVQLGDFPGTPLASAFGIQADRWTRAVLAVRVKSGFRLGLGTETRREGKKKRIAILGGGLAGVATALYLSDPRNPNCARYDITIYQQGWRLGGKGASGRSQPEGGQKAGDSGLRIEEHGLHIWLGFYENAFRLMRGVYEEWDIPVGHPWWAPEKRDRWRSAFQPSYHSCHVEPQRDGSWELWNLCYPKRPGTPGDAHPLQCNYLLHAATAALEWMEYFHRLLKHEECPDECLKKWLETSGQPRETPARPGRAGRLGGAARKGGVWGGIAQMLDLAVCLTWLPAAALRLLPLLGWKRKFERLDDVRKREARKVYVFLDLAEAVVKGIAWNVLEVAFKGLDALDEFDLREFLRKYGADKSSVESQIVDSLYDGLFAVPEGRLDSSGERFLNESLAAGAGIRCFINITLAYKEAPMWKMNAGMGDVVFAPAYEVLKNRGVKIRLFHRVESLRLSGDKKRIASVELREQARVKARAGGDGERAEYDPLIPVKTGSFSEPLRCWPSEPLFEQLEEEKEFRYALRNEPDLRRFESGPGGDARKTEEEAVVLQNGRDFDHVVLAIPVGALGKICPDLMDADPRFAEMAERVKTVRTAAYQAWLGRSLKDLGWEGPPPVLGNFIDPLNTWADMTHLAPLERFSPMRTDPAHIAYFVGAMPDDIDPQEAEGEVRKYARRVLNEMAEHFWPGARGTSGAFENSLILSEYFRANTTLSDRYVLSVAGSTKYRLWPDEARFENLVLAGDWTRNYLNIGCVEATVISAMLAAQAISGYPEQEDIAHSDRF